ncbi:hypothetical protein [Rummeliibacillus pycnus]|uniref:hypothetical protein n=1 Tax=Rummeliibacillus pycnus TaxID=101070 RepID=UPI000C9B07BE|nr:hypothetical protein [Rummeliibacillus pycnus]
MDLSLILMIVGIMIMIASFFVGNHSKKVEKDFEELSLNLYQESNQIKRRLKVIEEELLIAPQTFAKTKKNVSPKTNAKVSINGIHQILISQVLNLHKQGYNTDEISKRSSLSSEQVQAIIASGGNHL